MTTTTITSTSARMDSRLAAASTRFGGSPMAPDPLLVSGVASTGGGLVMWVRSYSRYNIDLLCHAEILAISRVLVGYGVRLPGNRPGRPRRAPDARGSPATRARRETANGCGVHA